MNIFEELLARLMREDSEISETLEPFDEADLDAAFEHLQADDNPGGRPATKPLLRPALGRRR